MLESASNNNMAIKEAVIGVVAFFDLFNCPLTAMEIWRYLDVKCDLSLVVAILDDGELFTYIDNKNGFYFLQGRSEILITRQDRYRFSDRKFKQALKISRIFRLFPWVKMIAVGNIIGAHNMKDGGDIDFFIIAQSGRIWLTRLFCATVAKILGIRPVPGDTRDKICLSFFISEKDLDMQRFLLPNEKDLYFIHWLAGLIPIYVRGGVYDKLIAANEWLSKELPNWSSLSENYQRIVSANFLSFIFKPLGLFPNVFERLAKKIQLAILPEQIRNIMNKDNRVMVSDEVLKLHVNDRREIFSQNYKKKLDEIRQIVIKQ